MTRGLDPREGSRLLESTVATLQGIADVLEADDVLRFHARCGGLSLPGDGD